MKLDKINKKIVNKTIFGCTIALTISAVFGGTADHESMARSGKLYAGVLGGGTVLARSDISQFGTAYFLESDGGALAVNALGTSKTSFAGVLGGHIGYAWSSKIGTYLPVAPAVELEGYYVGGATIKGHTSNYNIRAYEQNFKVNYQLKTSVLLANVLLNSNSTVIGVLKPYLGFGIGSAVTSISNAKSYQLNPVEPEFNHYNSKRSDQAVTFAVQTKLGVRYNLSTRASAFAEYRLLNLAKTNFTLGSGIIDGHPATSPWTVKVKNQYYNTAIIGVDFDL